MCTVVICGYMGFMPVNVQGERMKLRRCSEVFPVHLRLVKWALNFAVRCTQLCCLCSGLWCMYGKHNVLQNKSHRLG